MKLKIILIALSGLTPLAAQAFCGFYVAKADAKLFNKASQVVLVREDDRTVMTMANDYQGDPKEFAVVIPVPTFLEKSQIHVGDQKLIDHLDAYSAPRLVEYHDPDPCHPIYPMASARAFGGMTRDMDGAKAERERALGVQVEATYTVGEYDILILSAKESNGLETWLKENGYKIPEGAAEVLGSYIKQKVRFFVAKVNIEEKAKSGVANLRPLQVAFESPKFMLPIRLGTVNANGPQELFIYTLTRKGRVETTNYRTVKLPTGMDVPLFVKEEFGDFYKALFERQVKKEDMRCVFTEYAWDTGSCDPCAAEPPAREDLKKLGVFWLDDEEGSPFRGGRFAPPRNRSSNVFLTRLHVRYDREHFPEDLVFQETGDRENFQGRYVLRHPWKGVADCAAARKYQEDLPARGEKEAQTLSMLTGWEIEKVRDRMSLTGPSPKAEEGKKWWDKLWK